MSAQFDRFYDTHLARIEGGVVEHPNDSGGKTWYGISEAFLESIGRTGPISRAQARTIAHDYFWKPNGCEQMDPVAAWCYCDALFNHSRTAAIKIFQHALEVNEDGVDGPKTQSAARSINRTLFIERYRVRRTRYYSAIVSSDPTQLEFLTGWIERVYALQQAMLIEGLLREQLQTLPWYSPDRVSDTVKSSGIALGMFTLVLSMLWPDVDIQNLLGDPESLKAGIVGLITYLAARWRGGATIASGSPRGA